MSLIPPVRFQAIPAAGHPDAIGVWRASQIPDTGPIKVRPGMEGEECWNGAGNTARSTALKR